MYDSCAIIVAVACQNLFRIIVGLIVGPPLGFLKEFLQKEKHKNKNNRGQNDLLAEINFFCRDQHDHAPSRST